MRRWAGLGLLLWAGQSAAATVSMPLDLSAPLPADVVGAGKTLDRALTGVDTSTGDRNLGLALDLQRADPAGPGARPGTAPGTQRPAPTLAPGLPGLPGKPAQATTPAQALTPAGVGITVPSSLAIGGLPGLDAGLAAPRAGSQDAGQRWANAQGSGNLGQHTSSPVPAELHEVQRWLAALRDFLHDWRGWLLGGVALLLVVAGLGQLLRQRAGQRSGQSAIERAARRGNSQRSSHRN